MNTTGWVEGTVGITVAVLTNGNASEQYGIDIVNGRSSIVWRAMGSWSVRPAGP
jgi:hypothetical protein